MSARARILVVEDEPIVAMCLEDMLDPSVIRIESERSAAAFIAKVIL